MSIGSDVLHALKVCRKGGATEVLILAASERFLDVMSPNDARALVSFEKLRRRSWISTDPWISPFSSAASNRCPSCRRRSQRFSSAVGRETGTPQVKVLDDAQGARRQDCQVQRQKDQFALWAVLNRRSGVHRADMGQMSRP